MELWRTGRQARARYNHGMKDALAQKRDAALACLRGFKRAVVAFSGGVDSVLVARLAVEALGAENVLAVTGRSPSLPRKELTTAAELARECGAPHEFVDTHEFADQNYVANLSDRCYFCKTELYSLLARFAAERDFDVVLSGANVDDCSDYRPGLGAAKEQNVCAPLVDAGITKDDVRELAAGYGLSIHDKPASPCLSSRVQYGEQITPTKLGQIDAAETFLRELGFPECRVRHHDNLARIEVPASAITRLAEPNLRGRVDAKLRELGYKYVALDLRGFRTGSMNEVLELPIQRNR